MLTPQEVSERAFPKASFGGYNMTQVDEFLDVLTEDYSALYSENAVLKSKMKVLVEKVEEYRSTEEAMRKALMTAQRMADDLVKEAEQKRDQILQEAAAEAQAYLDQLDQLVPAAPDQQEEKMEEAVSDIDDSVQRLVAQAMAEAAAENEKVRQAGESQPAEDLSDTAEFPAQKVQPEENGDMEKTTRIDFGELQFGRDYEIK